MLQFQEEKAEHKLEVLRRKEEEESAQLLSQKYGIPYADLSKFPVEVDAIKTVPEEKARRALLAVFQKTGKNLKVAVANPGKEETAAALKRLAEEGYQADPYLASRSGLAHAWEFYRRVPEEHVSETGTIQIAEKRLAELEKELWGIEEVINRIKNAARGPATEALEIILAGALTSDASDVHIEPQENEVRLRYRIDGVLRDLTPLPVRLYRLLLSRIKLIAELKLNIHDKAQDGRFTVKIPRPPRAAGMAALGLTTESPGADSLEVEIRVSVLPGPNGENIVLRVLNPKDIRIPLGELGMQPEVLQAMEKELKKPNGMILTTGPTGSGKTTTLYSFIQKIHTPSVKIITIEDPVEYRLAGVEQTQVDPEKGYDFSNGLRAIVRQDPDIILVGEIRDLETAETAMHAALTGHLVFSTLHTNDAAGTIPRLLDLGVKPNIIAPAINISMAQRLVRRLCKECRIPLKLEAETRERIKKDLAEFPHGAPLAAENQWTVFKANSSGCPACHGEGYKGRIGIFEIILIDEKLEQLILRDPSEYEIKKAAKDQRQFTMRQDGLLKILAGITDFGELERVVGA